MKKALTLAFIMAITTSLSACGFALRGTQQDATILNPNHATVAINLPNDQAALALKQTLIKQLQQLGISNQITTNNAITINHLTLRRYELVGTLSEIRLVLMANVSYTIDGDTHTASVQAEQSYQYNEASVSTLDQQGEKTKIWLYDRLAQRIAEQYYAKIKASK